MSTTALAPPAPTAHHDDDTMFDDPQLAIPGVDGYQVHRIALKIAGTAQLDRSNPDHVNTFRNLKLGQRVSFIVEGYVIEAGGGKAQIAGDGQVELVHGVKTVKIDTATPNV